MTIRRLFAVLFAVLFASSGFLSANAKGLNPSVIVLPPPPPPHRQLRRVPGDDLIIDPRPVKFEVRNNRRTRRRVGGSAETQLIVGNTTGANVFAYVTYGGGITANSLTYTPSTSITVNFTPYNQAMFTLPTGQTMTISNPNNGDYLSGNVAFIGTANQPPFFPTNCPDIVNFPNGCTLGEFTLNAGANQESVDVSCVNGVNTTINIALSGGASWTDNVTSITNQGLLTSSQPEGVYPAGCDACNASLNPPLCSGSSANNCPNGQPCCPSGGVSSNCWKDFLPSCSTTKCQLNRANPGGTVTITCQSLTTAWDDDEQSEKISAR